MSATEFTLRCASCAADLFQGSAFPGFCGRCAEWCCAACLGPGRCPRCQREIALPDPNPGLTLTRQRRPSFFSPPPPPPPEPSAWAKAGKVGLSVAGAGLTSLGLSAPWALLVWVVMTIVWWVRDWDTTNPFLWLLALSFAAFVIALLWYGLLQPIGRFFQRRLGP
jgi:hypothetical protein